MRTLGAGVIVITLFGIGATPAIAQPKVSPSPATRARVFAEPG